MTCYDVRRQQLMSSPLSGSAPAVLGRRPPWLATWYVAVAVALGFGYAHRRLTPSILGGAGILRLGFRTMPHPASINSSHALLTSSVVPSCSSPAQTTPASAPSSSFVGC
jgi:hypothetical protein